MGWSRVGETISIPWVNDGEPFELNPKGITPAAQRRSLTMKSHVLKEQLQGTRDMHESIVAELRREALLEAVVRATMILIHDMLANVDPKIRKMTPDEVRERLTPAEVGAIERAMKALAAEQRAEDEEDEQEDPPTPAGL